MSDFEFHDYPHASGRTICVAVFDSEILVVTGEEARNGKWLYLGKREIAGIADVEKYWRYICGSPD